MIYVLILIAFLAITLVGYLLYALHERVEKMSSNQAVMVTWCDTLRQNQETLLNDLKKIQYECQALQKETRSK